LRKPKKRVQRGGEGKKTANCDTEKVGIQSGADKKSKKKVGKQIGHRPRKKAQRDRENPHWE